MNQIKTTEDGIYCVTCGYNVAFWSHETCEMEQHEADNLHIIHLNKVIDELRKRIHELETHNYHQWQTMFAFGKEYTWAKKEDSQ